MLDRDMLSRVTKEWDEELIRKNIDYGDSFNDLRLKTGVDNFIDRLTEKIERYRNVTKDGNVVEDETALDTLRDIANYCKLEYLFVSNKEDLLVDKAEKLLEGTNYTITKKEKESLPNIFESVYYDILEILENGEDVERILMTENSKEIYLMQLDKFTEDKNFNSISTIKAQQISEYPVEVVESFGTGYYHDFILK